MRRVEVEGRRVTLSNYKLLFRKKHPDEDWDYPPTMAQWNREAQERPITPDELIARRLLRQNVADVVIGPAPRRLAYIDEIRQWMSPGVDNLFWSWDYWCEMLGKDPSYMRSKWGSFLEKCEAKARGEIK